MAQKFTKKELDELFDEEDEIPDHEKDNFLED